MLSNERVHWCSRGNGVWVSGPVESCPFCEAKQVRAEVKRLRVLCSYAERALHDPPLTERHLIDELRCQLKKAAEAEGDESD